MPDKQFEKEKARKLSPAEQRRIERFDALSAELMEQGYEKHELTVGIVRANVVALVLAIPLCIVAALVFNAFNPKAAISGIGPNSFIIFFAAIIVLTVVHELIHGITWSCFSEHGWKDIDFGFMVEYLTPYCTCSTPLPKGAYITGALMPLIVLGIIPTIAAIALGSWLLLTIGLVMIISAGGDMLIVFELLRHRQSGAEMLIYDHPTQAGCATFER